MATEKTASNMPALEDMALFMDKLPENPSDNPDLAALQSLVYDDSTPEEIAENFKAKGNECLKKGKRQYKNAITYYEQAIDQKSGNAEQNSVYYSNKAHVHLLLGNNRHALDDSEEAVKLNPSNIKAHYRAAKSALALWLLGETVNHCKEGLERDPSNEELNKLLLKAREYQQQEEKQAKEAAEARAKAEALARALQGRGVRLGRPQFADKVGVRQPWLDSGGLIHWPVLLLYPEVMSSDIVDDWCETDTLRLHLDQVFSSEAPPLPWDEKGEYTRTSIEIYFQANAVPPYRKDRMLRAVLEGSVGSALQGLEEGDDKGSEGAELEEPDWSAKGEQRWVKLEPKWTLAKILSEPNHVVPGVPVLYVLARGSKFQQQFLSGEWSLP